MSEVEERLYHNLQELTPIENVSDQMIKNLSYARIKEIQAKRHELEMNLKHYKKMLKRWKKIGNTLRISGIIIVGGCTATTIVLGFGTFSTPLILGIMAGIGGVGGFLSESLALGLVKKKIAIFSKKIEHIQEYISKSWYLFNKIKEDGIVTLQEIEEFGKLMGEYEKGISAEDPVDDSMDKEYIKLRESLRPQVEKEAKKDVKEVLKNEMIQELKQKYMSK